MKLFLVSVQDDYENLARSLIETHYSGHNFELEGRQFTSMENCDT